MIAKHYMEIDQDKSYNALKATNQLLLTPELAREIVKTNNIELAF